MDSSRTGGGDMNKDYTRGNSLRTQPENEDDQDTGKTGE